MKYVNKIWKLLLSLTAIECSASYASDYDYSEVSPVQDPILSKIETIQNNNNVKENLELIYNNINKATKTFDYISNSIIHNLKNLELSQKSIESTIKHVNCNIADILNKSGVLRQTQCNTTFNLNGCDAAINNFVKKLNHPKFRQILNGNITLQNINNSQINDNFNEININKDIRINFKNIIFNKNKLISELINTYENSDECDSQISYVLSEINELINNLINRYDTFN